MGDTLKQGNESDTKDPKDFTEQLRTVHFTLTIACLGLLVVVTAGLPYVFQRAHEELNEISDLVGKWNLEWLHEAIVEQHPESLQSCQKPAFESLNLQFGNQVVSFKTTGPNWTAYSPNSIHMTSRPLGTDVHFQMLTPTNLQDFKDDWDTKVYVMCPTFLMPGPVWVYDRTQFRPFEMIKTDKKADFSTVQVRFTQNNSLGVQLPAELNQEGFSYAGFSSEAGNFYVFPTIVSREKAIPFRKKLADKAGKNWKEIAFADQFRELDQASEKFKKVKFEDAPALLDLASQSSKDSFEALTIKFSTEAAARWGVLIIIEIQFYLFLHLREFRKRNFGESSVAWIGSYAGLLPRCIVLFTVFALPILTVVWCGVRKDFYPSQAVHWTLAGMAVLISVWAASATIAQYLALPVQRK